MVPNVVPAPDDPACESAGVRSCIHGCEINCRGGVRQKLSAD